MGNRFRPVRRPRCLAIERLEPRLCLSLNIQIDYSLDTLGFFNDPSRRAILQTAADTLGSRITDNLLAIRPGGGNSWTAQFPNPSTGLDQTVGNLDVPANTLIVYAGGRPISGGTLGEGGPGGFGASGDSAWISLVQTRGQAGAAIGSPTDFGPWGGALTFNTSTSWYFGLDQAGIGSGQNDFLSVALHELTHLMGFGTAQSFAGLVSGGSFTGAQSTLAYDGLGSPPLNAGGDHWSNGTTDAGFEVAMDPTLLEGTRKLLTPLDLAALDDLGWDLAVDPNATIASATVRPTLDITAISTGGTFSDPSTTLELPTDVDLYRVTIDHADVLDFTSSPFTYLRLFNSLGAEIAHSTTALGAATASLPSAGTYYLGISGAGNTRYSPINPLSQSLAGPTGSYFVRYQRHGTSGGASPAANLAVSLAASDPATQGSALSQTIQVTNLGPDEAQNVSLVTLVPSSASLVSIITSQGTASLTRGIPTATIGSLAAGSTVLIVVQLIPTNPGNLVVTATAQAATDELDASDNTASTTLVVRASSMPGPTPGTPPPGTRPVPVSVASARIQTLRTRGKRASSLVVTFSKPLDASSVLNRTFYRLVRPGKGRNARVVTVRLKPPQFDGESRVTLTPAGKAKLTRGLQLTILASLLDRDGLALDGNGDGQGGDDAVVSL